MRAVLAFIAVNSFFVAICGAFGLFFLCLAWIGNNLTPVFMESWWFTLPIGFTALGAALWLAYRVTLIGKPPRNPARGSG